MSKISRRDLLQFIGAGGVGVAGGVLYGESIERNVELLIPQVTAGLNALYNPDRIRTPLKNAAQRGSGNFEEISWDEALTTVGSRIGRLRIDEEAGRVGLLTGRVRGHLDELLALFMGLLGSERYQQYDFTYPSALIAANKISFGTEVLPYYDIKNADYLLSFGADYLGTWISPVHHSLAYGHLRQGRVGRRGKTVQVEPRMSQSGANADEWIAARPGTEGLLALGIAHALVSNGPYTGSDRDAWTGTLRPYSPSRVSAETGVGEDRIEGIAREFAASSASLAIAGGATAAGSNAVASVVAVNVLNHLAANLGKSGGIIFNAEPASSSGSRISGLKGVLDLVEAMEAGEIDVLLLHDSNPVFALPGSVRFQQALKSVPMVVAMSSFRDETTEMADLILPTNTYLESWGSDVPDPGVGFPVASISQPVVAPLYDTLPTGDIILSLARQIGGEVTMSMRWGSMEEFVKARWREVYERHGADKGFEEFWAAAVEAGVRGEPGAWDTNASLPSGPSTVASIGDPVSKFSGDEREYPLVLHPYLTTTFLDGRGANLPWLQELPDPMTSVVYGSWAELNPVTASEMGIEEGDILEVETTAGSVRVPALVFPAIMPGVVAMPIGQGHTSYGRYARDRGANPIQIVAPVMDDRAGDLAWAATRANIRNTGERVRIVKTDGVTRTLGRQILGPGNEHA
jgi:anaerobic selenocysteine-containing dehydrogenase